MSDIVHVARIVGLVAAVIGLLVSAVALAELIKARPSRRTWAVTSVAAFAVAAGCDGTAGRWGACASFAAAALGWTLSTYFITLRMRADRKAGAA